MIEKLNNTIEKTVQRTSIITNHPLAIFTLYAVTFFIYRDLGVRMFIGYGILLLFVGLILIDSFRSKSINRLNDVQFAYILYVSVVFLNYLRPESNHDNSNTVYILVMLLTGISICFSKINTSEIRLSLRIFSVSGVIFSGFILFFQIFRSLYWSLIYPLLSETAAVYAKKYFFEGYSVSIGGLAYTDYILIFGFISILAYVLYNKIEKLKEKILYVILAVVFFTLILVGRRGELIAFIISIGVFYIASGGEGMRLKRTWILLGILLLLVALVVLLLPILEKIEFLHRYTMTIKALFFGGQVEGGVASGRLRLYSAAWDLIVENPMFGIGWGNFAQHATYVLGYAPEVKMDVHNMILQLLAETGIVGSIFIISPIVYLNITAFKQCGRLWLRRKSGHVNPLMLTANTVSLLFQTFILIVAFVDPSNYKTIYWVFYFIAIYLQLCSNKLEHSENYGFANEIGRLINSRKNRL